MSTVINTNVSSLSRTAVFVQREREFANKPYPPEHRLEDQHRR